MARATGLAGLVLLFACSVIAGNKQSGPSKSGPDECLPVEAGNTTASGCRFWQRATTTGTIWHIDEPVVSRPRSEYPAITFQKFDEVVITGGGCVRTGGTGLTWKRYIDPSGDNSDRLYHGRIWIPGATAGFVRLSSVALLPGVPLPASVPLPPGVQLFVNYFPPHSDSGDTKPYHLHLGYEDDDYHDNGYDPKYAHDNGTDNQCAVTEDLPGTNGRAWLEIQITHHSAAQTVPSPVAPLDLWWDQVDDNFLAKNPDWWVHHDKAELPNSNTRKGCDAFREGKHDHFLPGRDPKCTMADPDIDEANTLSSFCHLVRTFSDAVHGHVNWAVATYQGRIFFDTANIGSHGYDPGDGDYDWWLEPEDDKGQHIDNGISQGDVVDGRQRHAIALEFSSRETVDQIKKPKTWWNDFHDAVDSGPEPQTCAQPGGPKSLASCMVDGKPAIVIGLLGFDNEHGDRPEGARVELHPVYGLAIKIADRASGSTQDVWAIMARNWGNEGSCSNGFDVTGGKWQHYLPLIDNKMQFFVPAKLSRGAAAQWVSSSPAAAKILDDGVLVTIQLPEPEKKKLFWGELHITSP